MLNNRSVFRACIAFEKSFVPALPLKCLSCLDSMWKLVCSLTKRLVTKTWPTFFCSTLSLLFPHELLCQLTIWSHLHWSRRCSRAAPWVVELLPRVQERPPPGDGASWKGNCRIYCRECLCSLSLLWRVSCSGSHLHQKLQILKIISYFRFLRNYDYWRKYLTPGSLGIMIIEDNILLKAPSATEIIIF